MRKIVIYACAMLASGYLFGQDTTIPSGSVTTTSKPNLTSPVESPKINTETTSKVKDRSQEILDLWFGPLEGANTYPTSDKTQAWFSKTAENQSQMRENFQSDILKAVKGDYNGWRATPKGRLALILLLDQIPRNVYGNKPQAFASDRMAQGLVLEGLQNGDDLRLLPIERVFFYLPLIHSENPEYQKLAVSKYQSLVNEALPTERANLQEFLTYAMIHRNIINKFGRFPARNAALGRLSTPEEVSYLKEWGSYPN